MKFIKRKIIDPFVSSFSFFKNIRSWNDFLSLFRFNITFKMTLGFVFLILLIVLILNVAIWGVLKWSLYQNAYTHLENQSILTLEKIRAHAPKKVSSLQELLDRHFLDISIFDKSLNCIASSKNMPQKWSPLLERRPLSFRKYFLSENIYFQDFIFLNGENFIFLSTVSMETALAVQRSVGIFLISLSIFLILWAMKMSSRLSRHHLQPLSEITEDVKSISVKNMDLRLNLRGTKDELKDLAFVFNSMMDDIQKGYERQRQFVSDASHELRTPLAVIKGYANMLDRWGKNDPAILEESISALKSEANHMQCLIEGLLFIARNEKMDQNASHSFFELSPLLYTIEKETGMLDSQHKIHFYIEDKIKIWGDKDKIKQAFRIFIDNALKYTPSFGNITVRLEKKEGAILFSVSDTGIGISQKDLPFIFERFYRADKSRTRINSEHAISGSYGLGLPIAKIIIEQHKGTIKVDSALGKGTIFSVFVPINYKIPPKV